MLKIIKIKEFNLSISLTYTKRQSLIFKIYIEPVPQ